VRKLVTFIRATDTTDPDRFARFWRGPYLESLRAAAPARDHLTRAVHNHVLPIEVRPDAPASASMWSGIGCYYFDSDDAARDLLASPEMSRIVEEHRIEVAQVSHLLCRELFIFDKKPESAPLKMFAFFKRLPSFTRAEALSYYSKDHAALANNKYNPIVKYFQNHVVAGYTNPDSEFDYDGGPESWFRSLEQAQALFNHAKSMELAAKDEAYFVQRDQFAHFFTDEVEVYERP
jgi:hypothetical protein